MPMDPDDMDKQLISADPARSNDMESHCSRMCGDQSNAWRRRWSSVQAGDDPGQPGTSSPLSRYPSSDMRTVSCADKENMLNDKFMAISSVTRTASQPLRSRCMTLPSRLEATPPLHDTGSFRPNPTQPHPVGSFHADGWPNFKEIARRRQQQSLKRTQSMQSSPRKKHQAVELRRLMLRQTSKHCRAPSRPQTVSGMPSPLRYSVVESQMADSFSLEELTQVMNALPECEDLQAQERRSSDSFLTPISSPDCRLDQDPTFY